MRPWVLSAQVQGHAYFRELRYGEVRRIPLPRTPVNKAKAAILVYRGALR
jgi:hypothetical protein